MTISISGDNNKVENALSFCDWLLHSPVNSSFFHLKAK